MNVVEVAMPVVALTLNAAVGAEGGGGVDDKTVTVAVFDAADSPALLNAVTRTLYVPAPTPVIAAEVALAPASPTRVNPPPLAAM